MSIDIPTWQKRGDTQPWKGVHEPMEAEIADLRAELARRDAVEDGCKYPNCTCIGAGVFKACRRPAVVSEGQAVADGPYAYVREVNGQFAGCSKDQMAPDGGLIHGWVEFPVYTRPAAPAPEAPTETYACEPIWKSEDGNMGDIVQRCQDCGTYKGAPCRVTPATEQAPTNESGEGAGS